MSIDPGNVCGWVGPFPEGHERKQCVSCGLMRSINEVAGCKIKGRSKAAPPAPPEINSGIGECLKKHFEGWGITATPTCSCRNIQKILDATQPEAVEKFVDYYVEQVFANTANLSGLMGNLIKAASWLAPGTAKDQIRNALLECVNASKSPPNATE
jgi:hypothetical protein